MKAMSQQRTATVMCYWSTCSCRVHPPNFSLLPIPFATLTRPPPSEKVSEGVFRSGYPIACNFPFLRRLGLRSVLCLCPESVLPGSLAWAKDTGVRMEMCDLGENSPPFVSMPLAAMRKAVDYLSGECNATCCVDTHILTGYA